MAIYGRTVMGIDPDEAIDPNDMAEFAAFTNQAGISMQKSLSILKLAGADVAKDFGMAGEIVEEFANTMQDVSSLESFRKELKLLPSEINTSRDAVSNMLTVIGQGGPKGVKKLFAEFGNERTKKALQNIIGKDLTVKLEKGKKSDAEELKTRLFERSEEIRMTLAEIEDTAVDMKKIAERNARLADTAGSKFQDALNKIQVAFQQPDMIEAINSLAAMLPKLVKGFAALMDFATKFPKAAALMLVGGKIAMAGAGGFVSGLFKGGERGAKGAAGALGGMGQVINVQSAVINVGGLGGASQIGQQIGKAHGKTAVKFFNPGDTGKIIGILAGAAIAEQIGEELIEYGFSKVEKSQTSAATIGARGVGAKGKERDALITEAKKGLAELQEFESGGTMNLDRFKNFGEATRLLFGNLANMTGYGLKDKEGKTVDPMSDVRDRIKKFQTSIKELEAAKKAEADANKRMEESASRGAKALDKFNKMIGEVKLPKGPNKPGTVKPGSTPTP
jgi:hypothetical protein